MKRILIRPEDAGKSLRQFLREQGVAESVANHPTTLALTGKKIDDGKPRRKWKPLASGNKAKAVKGRIVIDIHGW